MTWWLWLLMGLALLAIELTTPGGFFVLFFGIGALLVGALAGAGVIEEAIWQWLLFSVLSVGSLLLFRRRLLAATAGSGNGRDALDSVRGEVAVLQEALAPGAIGRAELRGSSWTARNVGERPLPAGGRCRVERTEGLTLLVRGESES